MYWNVFCARGNCARLHSIARQLGSSIHRTSGASFEIAEGLIWLSAETSINSNAAQKLKVKRSFDYIVTGTAAAAAAAQEERMTNHDRKRKFMRKDFVALISKQSHLWPSTLKKFDRHKTSIADMKNALLSTVTSESLVASELFLTVSITYYLQSPPVVLHGMLRLLIADGLGCNEVTRRVLTSGMLEALQNSSAAIPGHHPVCITRPDVPQASREYLIASAFIPSTLEQRDFALQYIVVPVNGTLYLNITNQISDVVFLSATILSVLPPPSTPTIVNRDPKCAPRSCVDILIESLRMKAERTTGYAEFEKDRHRPLQNSRIDSVSGLIPSDSTIAEALGYGTSWLLMARRGTRILRKYGPESSNPVAAIVDEICTDRSMPQGIVAFSKFLQQQEVDQQ
ncbi:hypothetical protein EV360DRAFT_69006 [Lentinula raphanica]|nr:hypothetical protein EV360DRAFT_69006 [Lentinula raphanica]